jgi:hypothetical protein
MAWVGLETMRDGLMRLSKREFACDVEGWCKALELDELAKPIHPSKRLRSNRTVRDMWGTETDVIEFTGIENRHSKTSLDEWFSNRAQINDYRSALNMSQAFRHMTVHGLISPRGVFRFGFAPRSARNEVMLSRLVDAIVDVAYETLAHI